MKKKQSKKAVKRINIIGPSGAGKSVLAQELASIYDLPVLHIDSIAHQDKYNPLLDKPAFVTKMKKECRRHKWIIEGVYKSTLDYRMPRAGVTIYLDFPRRVYLWRVLKRRWQYRNTVRPDMPDGWQERLEWDFMKYVWSFHKLQKPEIEKELQKHPKKTILRFKTPSGLAEYVQSLK